VFREKPYFLSIIGVLLLALSQVGRAAGVNIDFAIPSQPLDSALLQFAEQADMDFLGLSEELSELTSPPVYGSMTDVEALDLILRNTGLQYQITPRRAVIIVEATPPPTESITEPIAEKAPDQPSTVLEEVTTFATRRGTNIQNTPIAVTSLSQFSMERYQVRDLRDIGNLVPGLELIDTAQQAAILVQLRGVGTTNITEIADGPVAIHIDGVYSPRSQGAAALLYDIDHVEVLRGPQGTLFGRNSLAGSINIYSQRPAMDEVSADISLSLGNYDHQEWRAAANIPVAESFSLRIAGASNQHDPYTDLLDNYAGVGPHYPATIDDLSDYDQALDLNQTGPEMSDQSSGRISALWQPGDNFSAFVSVERYRDKSTGIAELDPTLVEGGTRGVVLDSPSFLDLTNDSLRSEFQYRFASDHTLSYKFGWSEMSREQIYDADNGRDGSFEQQRTDSSSFSFYSHEVHLLNGDDAQFKWLIGGLISEERNEIVFAVDQQNAGGGRRPEGASSWISDHGGAAVSYAVQPDRRVESLGLFAQGTYELNDNHRITLGARYTEDTKSDRGGRALACRVTSVLGPYVEAGSVGPGAPRSNQIYADAATASAIASGLPNDNGSNEGIGDEPCWIRQVNDVSKTWKNNSGLIRYDFDPVQDVMLYASVSTGFKSGHIQDAGNTASPETVLNYELGFKSEFLDNNLRLNAALYLADYDDLQFSGQDRLDTNGDGVADTGGSTVVRNASEATIKGLEVELEWSITANDHLQFVGTVMDAGFDDFEIPDTLFGDLFNPYASDQSNSPMDPVDLSGNSPARTPDWKFTLIYEHDFALGGGYLTPRLVATFSDSYYLDIYNRDDLEAGIFPGLPDGGRKLGQQDAYQIYDLSARFVPGSGKWMAEVFMKNITDEDVKISSGNFITENGFVATYTPPQTYGLTLSYAFGGG
jgi:iron complex outermembrane receptor protein